MTNYPYKYWVYYIRSNKSIYAYTNKKSIRNKFREMRNLKDFFYEKKVELSKPEVNALAKEYQTGILSIKRLPSYDWVNLKKVNIDVAITEWEYSIILGAAHSAFIKDITAHTWCDIKYFTNDMRHLLKLLNYDAYQGLITGNINDNNPFSTESVSPDYFQLFIKNFNTTMKG